MIIGFQPSYQFIVDGRDVYNFVLADQAGWESASNFHDAVITRLDFEYALDEIATLTIEITGVDAAKLATFLFPKQPEPTEIELKAGYLDTDEPFLRLFKGHVLSADPTGLFPLTVECYADSPTWRVREHQIDADGTDDDQSAFIISEMSKISEIEANLEEWQSELGEAQADPGGATTGNFLQNINAWCEESQLHWIDRMDGFMHFFFAGSKPPVLGRNYATWELPIRGGEDKELAAVLAGWDVKRNVVDMPSTITAGWTRLEDDSGEIVVEPIEVTVENGLPDSVLNVGYIEAATKEAAEKILEKMKGNYEWHTFTGSFDCAVGLPIVALDDIIAKNGYQGLEDRFDKPFEVTGVHHTFDASGWRVKGQVRGGRA